jgi:hypothetical protein
MPFTLSHPAAVLPLRRWCPNRFDFAALVIGSMTPDLGYYIPGCELATFAHTMAGSFAVCLPSGIALLLLFYLLRRPVCFSLPMPHREALLPLCAASPIFGIRPWGVILISLLIGAWTHILWDSFTHPAGWFVHHIGWLDRPVFRFGSTVSRAHYLLQQISTIAGAVILGGVYVRWLKRNSRPGSADSRSDRWRYPLWGGIVVFGLVTSLPLAVRASREYYGYVSVRVFLFSTAVYFVSTAACLIVVSSLIIWRARICGLTNPADNQTPIVDK